MYTLINIFLLFCGVGTVLCDPSSEQFTFDRTASRMTTVIKTEDKVYHMEMDKHAEGNLLFSDKHSLKTTDFKRTQTIAGDASDRGYKEGKGIEARFRYITAFCQISKTKVVVTDNTNHCLRLIDRPSRQTRTLSGTCTRKGYEDGHDALFYYPRDVIIDNQVKGKLLVTDEGNKAVRQVDVTTGAATTFFVDKTLNYLLGITQEVSSGDLYLTSYSDIYTLNYQSRQLTLTARDHMRDGAKFDKPPGILLLDNTKKLIIADEGNDRLVVLDRESKTTSTLCTGEEGHGDGDLRSCSLDGPRSLLVIGNTLFIGEDQRIRMLSGQTIPPTTSTTTSTTTTTTTPSTKPNTTVLTMPTTTPTTTTTTTPKTTPKTTTTSTSAPTPSITPTTKHNFTTMPTNSPTTMLPCERGNITKELQPGEKTVDVETEPGRITRLPAGAYIFMFTSNMENCAIHVHINKASSSEPDKDLCAGYSIVSTESESGNLDITCGDVVHRLSLPVGEYKYQKLHREYNCSALIDVKDSQLVRRLNIKAEYDVSCDVLTNPVTKSSVMALAVSHFTQIEGSTICGKACKMQIGGDVKLNCVNTTLSILWPTDQTYGGHVTQVPVSTQSAIRLRLKKGGGPSLKIFIISLLPPVVLPVRTDVVLVSSCMNNKLYSAETDSCI